MLTQLWGRPPRGSTLASGFPAHAPPPSQHPAIPNSRTSLKRGAAKGFKGNAHNRAPFLILLPSRNQPSGRRVGRQDAWRRFT